MQRVANDVVAQELGALAAQSRAARSEPAHPDRQGTASDHGTHRGAARLADAVGQEIGEKNLKTLATLISRVTEASRRYRQAAGEEPSP